MVVNKDWLVSSIKYWYLLLLGVLLFDFPPINFESNVWFFSLMFLLAYAVLVFKETRKPLIELNLGQLTFSGFNRKNSIRTSMDELIGVELINGFVLQLNLYDGRVKRLNPGMVTKKTLKRYELVVTELQRRLEGESEDY